MKPKELHKDQTQSEHSASSVTTQVVTEEAEMSLSGSDPMNPIEKHMKDIP